MRSATKGTNLLLIMGLFFFQASYSNSQEPTKQSLTNSIGINLVLIPKGKFLMGSPPKEKGSDEDERRHEVTINRNFYLGMHEVTQGQYKQIMGENPSSFQGDRVAKRHPETNRVVKEVDSANHPVEQVSWENAVEFCQRLSALPEEKKAGRVYRLPTEAEWEYACRTGSKAAYSFGRDEKSLIKFGWYRQNAKGKTHAVGLKKANAWGLYDMHGNVSEWCSDWFGEYPKGTAAHGSEDGSNRVLRGGGWCNDAVDCRSARRNWGDPSVRNNSLGIRVALSTTEIPK
jgi:formylglycine-generating enzyme required for sulfatase activity